MYVPPVGIKLDGGSDIPVVDIRIGLGDKFVNVMTAFFGAMRRLGSTPDEVTTTFVPESVLELGGAPF